MCDLKLCFLRNKTISKHRIFNLRQLNKLCMFFFFFSFISQPLSEKKMSLKDLVCKELTLVSKIQKFRLNIVISTHCLHTIIMPICEDTICLWKYLTLTSHVHLSHTSKAQVQILSKLWNHQNQLCKGIMFRIKGCGMGPWLVLVSPCLRENVVATCKIWSFLCSLDNLLQKNVIVLFFRNQISKWPSFEKGLFLTYFSHFLVTREKLQKFLQHISQTHTYTYFAHPIDFYCLTNFEKNTNL